eukprot:212291_1
MVPFPEWIAIIYVVYIELVLKCLSHKYIQETGSWRSTSDIIPKQSTSYGTIRLGQIMSIEFDFLFNGRSNDVLSCEHTEPPAHGFEGFRFSDYQENFFRIGKKSTASAPDCYPSHFPSMWLGPLCSDNYLVMFFNSGYYTFPYVNRTKFEIECYIHHESLMDYGNLSTTQWHHITIAINRTQSVIYISGGGKPDYSNTNDMGMYASYSLGDEVPIWFATDPSYYKYGFTTGNGIFSNISIQSRLFTWTHFPSNAPSSPPTSSPTDATFPPTSTPTYSPTDSPIEAPTFAPTFTPTYSPTDSPIEAPTFAPTFTPTYSPTDSPTEAPTFAPSEGKSPSIVTIFKKSKDNRYFLLLLLLFPFIIFCGYRIQRYMSFVAVDKALVLIIGIAHFDGNELTELHGIESNVDELKELWINMYHYTVKICNEDTLKCSKRDVIKFIDIHKDELQDTTYKAVIVHILSHGFERDIFMTSDLKTIQTEFIEHELISTAQFVDHPGLIKLIFHHACRGSADYFPSNSGYVERPVAKKRVCEWCRCHMCFVMKSFRKPRKKVYGYKHHELAIPLIETEEHKGSEVSEHMRNSVAPLRSFSNTFSIQSQMEEIDVHSNCVVLYGNIETRCLSDAGQFTTSICRTFHKNANEIIKPDFHTLIRQIGNDMEISTNNAQICTSKGIGTLRTRIRFEPCRK